MKKIKQNIVTIMCIVLVSCNSTSDKSTLYNNQINDTTLAHVDSLTHSEFIPYFSFDNVEYYYLDISDEKFNKILLNEKRTEKEQQLLEILEEGHLKSLNDSTKISNIKELGYQKKTISTKFHASLENIFSKKQHNEWIAAPCIAIYRDILVFRLNGKIVGIAKIYFKCGLHEIVGTSLNTEYFGQSGDFNKLLKILKNENGQ